MFSGGGGNNINISNDVTRKRVERLEKLQGDYLPIKKKNPPYLSGGVMSALIRRFASSFLPEVSDDFLKFILCQGGMFI